eukprot:5689992-Amphidinium_carterae.1
MFCNGGIFVGSLGTLSVVATTVSVGVILSGLGGKAPLCGLAFLGGLGYLADGLLQLPRIIFLDAGSGAAYPVSRTGVITLLMQLPLAVSLMARRAHYPLMP